MSAILVKSAAVADASKSFSETEEKHKVDSFAAQQAQRAMGAGNPLAGSDNRASGSSYCTTCSRWHRPGVGCTNKSVDGVIAKGRRIAFAYPETGTGNSFHHPQTGAFTAAPKSGGALADHHMSRLQHAVARHHAENPAPVHNDSTSVPSQSESSVVQHATPFVAPAPVPQATQSARPAPLPVPHAIRGVHTLLNYKPEQKPPAEAHKRLEQHSGHLQGQQQNYLSALRSWQQMHTGN